MTVGELIEALKEFPTDMIVTTTYEYYGDPGREFFEIKRMPYSYRVLVDSKFEEITSEWVVLS